MMIVRKRMLKIQERLKMRVGIAYGSKRVGTCRSYRDVALTIEDLYRCGFKAFLLPEHLFSNVNSMSELYKEHYMNIIKMKNLASKYNIELSLHVSRFPEDPYLTERLKIYMNIASVADMRSLIIHPTFFPMMPKEQALKLTVYKINELVTEMGMRKRVGIENTGRLNELGSLEEIVDIHRRTHSSEPVVNFAHVHARCAGCLRSVNDFKRVIDYVVQNSRHDFRNNGYVIFSGVSYDSYGEVEHKNIGDSDISLESLIKALTSSNVKGTFIFQLPDREKELIDMVDELGDMVR